MTWAVTAVVFTRVGRATSPVAVNAFKTSLAAVIFTAVIGWRFGAAYVARIAPADVALLSLSGLIGLTLGDSLLFRSYLELGTRRAVLVFSLNPVMGAVGGVIFLGERLGAQAILGMALALGGVAWVIVERPEGDENGALSLARLRSHLSLGVFLALGAALAQAAGALIAKPCLAHLATLPATWIRMSSGALGLVAVGLAGRRLPHWWRGLVSREFLPVMVPATIMGPFLGVWCMFFSLAHTQTGITLTLLSTTPIWLLLLNVLWHRERVNLREVVGIVVAIAGIAVLMLRPAA